MCGIGSDREIILSLEVIVDSSGTDDDFIGMTGFTFQKVEEELVRAGWSALRQVSFKVLIERWKADLSEALKSLLDNISAIFRNSSPLISTTSGIFTAMIQTTFKNTILFSLAFSYL